MIVVVGTLSARLEGQQVRSDSFSVTVAGALAAAGEAVELVSKVGADDAGEALIAQLAASRIGHVALIRDAARATTRDGGAALDMDAADLQLALRYLTQFDAVLLVDPEDDVVVATVLDACNYAGARLVVTRPVGSARAEVPVGEYRQGPPPLEVERPAGDPAATVALLVALLVPDREPSAAD